MAKQYTLEELKKIHNLKIYIMEYVKKNWVELLENETFNDIIALLSLCPPQMYGTYLEDLLIKRFKGSNKKTLMPGEDAAKKVPAKENRGDAVSNSNSYYEIKASILTHKDSKLNLVQIRDQEIDYYLCIGIDLRNEKGQKTYTYLLTKEEMYKEVVELNAPLAHGTKHTRHENKHPEYRISIRIPTEKEKMVLLEAKEEVKPIWFKQWEKWENRYKKMNFFIPPKEERNNKKTIRKKLEEENIQLYAIMKHIQDIREVLSKNLNSIISVYSIEEVIYMLALMNSQFYGAKLETLVIDHIKQNHKDKKIEKVNSTENRGDFKIEDSFYELKVSILDHKYSSLNVVQIRPYQDNVNYYLIVGIDIRNKEQLIIYQYMLSKEDMAKELILMKAGSAHGVKGNHSEKTQEFRFSLYIPTVEEQQEYLEAIDKESSNFNYLKNFERWQLEYKNRKFIKQNFLQAPKTISKKTINTTKD